MLDLTSKFQRQLLKKWRPFQATDFQSLMCPCFTFCHILGIFPYTINASTFKMSKPRYILSTVVICMIGVFEIMLLHSWLSGKMIDFEDVPKALEVHFYYILSCFITIVTYILSGPRMRLLQTVMDVSSKLSSNTYKKLSQLIHAKDISGFFFFLAIMMICYSKLNTGPLLKLYTMYIGLVVFQMDMLYMNCVYILKACFKRLNDKIANLRKLVVKDVSHLFSRIYHHEQRNPFLLIELKALKKQHLMISDTVQMLNLVFSLQLLATMIITFGEITFGLYFYISQWPIFSNELPKDLWYSYFMMFVIYQFFKMLLMVWACETGKNQALEIGTTIHLLFNSISDKEVKHELKLFSLQILHRENIFSAKGLNVDATLVAAIVGNVTTYVLILMQFLLLSNSCDGNPVSTHNITQIN
ncbi:PREDICTED: uncharacterized protein LOC105455101 [Wasmannia auropunctata]|uniref:uncharacterized protein LOC105455101 n=1 Tax=Wasmannia auropunctata TaxID=64793 RepID=UPI0005EEE80F|nr:PREDICTED: uncharacterized protein LOC105455101 [Wasmannia auropunctata]